MQIWPNINLCYIRIDWFQAQSTGRILKFCFKKLIRGNDAFIMLLFILSQQVATEYNSCVHLTVIIELCISKWSGWREELNTACLSDRLSVRLSGCKNWGISMKLGTRVSWHYGKIGIVDERNRIVTLTKYCKEHKDEQVRKI